MKQKNRKSSEKKGENMAKTVTVGVFDSGLGGLTVLKECVRVVPRARYLYLGDNANAPYGSKPEEEIFALTLAAVNKLRRRGADVIVLACNTATAVCLERLRAQFRFPVLGSEPAVLPAARAAKDVLVLATPCTAKSPRLAALIARCPGCRFTVFPAEGLAAAVERWLIGGVPLRLGDHLPAGKFDGVVLGCTHFVFLRKEIAEYYRAPVFDGGEGVANRLKTVLFDRSRKIEGIGSHECLELDNRRIPPNSFQKTTKNAIIFLGSSKNANKCVYKQMFDNIFPYNSTKKCKKT